MNELNGYKYVLEQLDCYKKQVNNKSFMILKVIEKGTIDVTRDDYDLTSVLSKLKQAINSLCTIMHFKHEHICKLVNRINCIEDDLIKNSGVVIAEEEITTILSRATNYLSCNEHMMQQKDFNENKIALSVLTNNFYDLLKQIYSKWDVEKETKILLEDMDRLAEKERVAKMIGKSLLDQNHDVLIDKLINVELGQHCSDFRYYLENLLDDEEIDTKYYMST